MAERAAGILLHPTSFPGPFAVGDLGPEAELFLDWCLAAGHTVWQVLPLGPPAVANSPYTCLSAFAGNPLLISPQRLIEDGLLEPENLEGAPQPMTGKVDFGAAVPWKEDLLRLSWEHFQQRASDDLRRAFGDFQVAPEQTPWLDDWTLFSALRERQESPSWWTWPEELRSRQAEALEQARQELAEEIRYHAFLQFLFFRQWQRLRDAARERGLQILGDLPIYVALDSAEVWARPQLFELDDQGQPVAVAGVPPDYFSPTGQLWGNPLYRWDRMAEEGYGWWIDRLRANLRLADRVRFDHFRGFAGYWRVEASETTAENGEWVDGPGLALFEALRDALGSLPLVAEDLGEITPDVDELRLALGLPGMRVLHFAFGEVNGTHIPHRFDPNTVVYTGTHDNDTTLGWYASADEETRQRFATYAGPHHEEEVHRVLTRLAHTSVASLSILPVQDVIGLGGEARMNVPGLPEGNWAWRLDPDQLTTEHAADLRLLAQISGRFPTDEQGVSEDT